MRRLALFVLLLLPLEATATTVVALPEPALVRRSAAIVVASVLGTDTVIHPGGRIVTRATVQVLRGVRGVEALEVIAIEVPGGRLANGLVAHTPGSPPLSTGDLVFGFLERSGKVFRPLGLSYGLLRVRKDAKGTYKVYRVTDGLSMIGPDGRKVSPAAVAITDLPLDELVARIEREIDELEPPDPGTVKP